MCCALRRQSQVIRCRWPATTPVPTSRRVPESSSASARGAPRVPQPAFVHEGPAVGTCRPGTRTRWRQRYRATCRAPVHPALTPGTSAGRKRPMANPARRPSATCWADGRRRRLPQFLGRQHRGSSCQNGGQVHRMSWVLWGCSGSGGGWPKWRVCHPGRGPGIPVSGWAGSALRTAGSRGPTRPAVPVRCR